MKRPSPEPPNGIDQHPISPPPSTPLSPPPTFLLGNTPSVRLSSSPASSPRIVESPPARSHSIYPERGSVMAQGSQPGADFLELSSDDGCEWLDDNGTRNFEDVENMGKRLSNGTLESVEHNRGRERNDEYLTALPPFNQIPAHDSATGEGSLPIRRPPSQARQLSLRRYNKATVVHYRGSPRSSILSNASSDVMPRPLNVSRTVSQNLQDTPERNFQHYDSTQGSHHRDTSEVESIRMNAFLKAHYATLHAMDSQPNSPGQNSSSADPMRQRAASDGRHIRLLAPIQTVDDPNRPPHLPAHFIRTPYPFTPKKEFPPPRTRPRRTRVDASTDLDSKKSIYLLGMADDDEYDYRNRLERNMDAQGLLRPPTDATTHRVKQERWNSSRSTSSTKETVVWLSLRRNSRLSGVADRLEHITIPSSLVASEIKTQPSPTLKPKIRHIPVDFDDMYFAQELRSAYRKLSGPWLMRAMSASRLQYIKLSQVSAWSGSYIPLGLHEEAGTLLAARGGLATLLAPSRNTGFWICTGGRRVGKRGIRGYTGRDGWLRRTAWYTLSRTREVKWRRIRQGRSRRYSSYMRSRRSRC